MTTEIDPKPCCSSDEFTQEETIDWNSLTEAELKVALGRLVDNVQNGLELKGKLTDKLASTDRRWPILVRHLCMERIQKPETTRERRTSAKIADYLASIDQRLLKLAFQQSLEFCCDRFEDSFDALFQRVAAVVDFGKKLSPESIRELNMFIAEPLFKILRVQENTSDNNTYRLAFRFAQFLARIFSTDGKAFQVPDLVTDDIVARLFDSDEKEPPNDVDEERGLELEPDELEDLCRRKAPTTVKSYQEAFRSTDDPTPLIVAFECFPQFASNHRTAICAQSQQLISTLMQLENRFNLANFSSKVDRCVVHVLASDLALVPAFCDRLRSAINSAQRMKIINCIGALITHLLDNKPSDTTQSSNPKPTKKQPPTREIGRVVRKSVTLTKTDPKPTTRPAVNIVDPILRPFLTTVLNMELVEKCEPITIAGVLTLLYDNLQRNVPGFRRIIDEYFTLLANVRSVNDRSTQMMCVQAYAGLAQMAIKDSDRSEWIPLFGDVDEWLNRVVQQSITHSDRAQHAQLDEFHRELCTFLGKMNC